MHEVLRERRDVLSQDKESVRVGCTNRIGGILNWKLISSHRPKKKFALHSWRPISSSFIHFSRPPMPSNFWGDIKRTVFNKSTYFSYGPCFPSLRVTFQNLCSIERSTRPTKSSRKTCSSEKNFSLISAARTTR
jgi:hypothetical protein